MDIARYPEEEIREIEDKEVRREQEEDLKDEGDTNEDGAEEPANK